MMQDHLYRDLGIFTPDNLFAGLEVTPFIPGGVVIAAGLGVVPRRTVLGRASDGTCKPVDSTADDGTETPYVILANTVNTDTEPAKAQAYETGVFNRLALLFGGTDTIETHELEMRRLGMLTTENVPY